MNKVLAVSTVTLREALRQRLAVNLLVFAVALVSASLVISTLTFGEQYRIIVDIGLTAMEVFGTLIAVFLGAGLIAGDIERRTVYPVIAKPVSRAQYLAGRYAGLLAFYLRGLGFVRETPIGVTLCAMALQFAMIAAVAVFFSCLTTATLSAIFTLSLVVAGHLASDLVRYWSRQGAVAGLVGKALYLLVPNLEALNFKEAMVYRDALGLQTVGTAFAYGLLWSAGVVALAAAVFTRRDLR